MNHADIASYPEHAFRKYWNRILADPQFLSLVAKFTRTRDFRSQIRKSEASGGMSTLLKRGGLAFRGILSRMNTLKSWVDFQRFMIFLLDQLVERTTEGFTTSGL